MKHITVTSRELPDSEVELSVKMAWNHFETYIPKALKKLQKDIELPGFRKGFVPETMIASKIGDMGVLTETAEIAIQAEYENILKESNTNPIGQPKLSVTKIARGNDLEFTLTVAVLKKITLGDYKKIASSVKTEKSEVTEKDIDEEIERIRKDRAHALAHDNKSESKQDDHALDESKTAHEHDHTHDNKENRAHTENTSDEDTREHEHNHPLPEVNDEFVKTLGDFKDVADFKNRLKEHIIENKKAKALEKKRLAIIEGIIEASDIVIPKILVESELERMREQFEADISRMGIPVQEYYTYIKKTPDELKKEWTTDAEKRVKTDIILSEISIKEKIVPEKEKVEAEVSKIQAMYKDVDPLRAKIYVEHMLTNQAVFEFLGAM